MEKICTKCGVLQPIENFSKKGNSTSPRCKKCIAEYFRNYYHSNPKRKEYIKSRTKENSKVAKEKAIEIILEVFSTGCVDCGEMDVRVLEFDHQSDKEFNIASLINKNNIEQLKTEILKCEVVCANHHRIRTAAQFNTWRHRAVYPHADNV